LGSVDGNTLYVISGSVVDSEFPYTGSAIISGSLTVTGSIKQLGTLTTSGTITSNGLNTGASINVGRLKSSGTSTVKGGVSEISGGLDLSGSFTITGSAYGNIIALSEVSNTASVDLRYANFFTGSVDSNTHFNITNPKIGETAILKLTTVGDATASFSSNVLQPSGSSYVPSPGANNEDILTLVSFDGTSVYVVASNKFI